LSNKTLWLHNDELILDFPFSSDEVHIIKQIQGAKWDKVNKVWKAPATSIGEVREFAIKHDFVIDNSVLTFDLPKKLNKAAGMTHDESFIYLGFNYDPVKVRSVKTIPGATWHPPSKAWRIPKTAIQEAIRWATMFKMEIPPELRIESDVVVSTGRERADASRASSASLSIPTISGQLLPYQAAGVAYVAEARRCFIADDMGLGKTLQAIASLEYCTSLGQSVYPAIVICPPNLILNWKNEVSKWAPHRSVAVTLDRSTLPLLGESPHDFMIIGYSNIGHWAKAIKGYKSLICDESHFLKTPTALRTKAALKIAKTVTGGLVLCLTGTPVTNRPAEYASQLEVIGRLNDLGGTWGFYRRYCGAFKDKWGHWNISGATNLEELNETLRSNCYIRRTKKHVLKELPDVLHDTFMIQISDKAMEEYKKAEDDIVEFLVLRAKAIALELGKSPHSAAVVSRFKTESNEHLVRLSVLRRLAAKAKMGSVKEWVQSQIDAGEKVVIAAHHRDIVDMLANTFGGLKIQGGMKVDAVEQAKKDFQELSIEDAPVIVLSIQAAKTGHTLTAAQKVLFVELPWTPADVDQLYSRCHRLGQKGSVMVTYGIASGTIDEDILRLIKSKRRVTTVAIEGSFGEEEEEYAQGELMLGLLRRGLDNI